MIISRTPFRISFVGGGTDLDAYYSLDGGAVVSAAINKYMYITVNKKFDDRIRISYSQTEIVDDIEDINHDIARECLKLVGIDGGIEITSISDIPKGTGLGSSSAFTVGLLNALYTYAGKTLSARSLAEQACKIEIDVLGAPIGKQDQFASAYGGIHLFEFGKDGSVTASRINLSEHDYKKSDRKLMLFFLGESRNSNTLLEKQRKNTATNLDTLNEMRKEAYDLYEHLITTGFDEKIAEFLNEGWNRKRSLSDSITNPAIDRYYDIGIDSGALGGKLLGAGGSGFLLFYCDEQNQDAVRDALGLKEVDFRFTPNGSRVVYFA